MKQHKLFSMLMVVIFCSLIFSVFIPTIPIVKADYVFTDNFEGGLGEWTTNGTPTTTTDTTTPTIDTPPPTTTTTTPNLMESIILCEMYVVLQCIELPIVLHVRL